MRGGWARGAAVAGLLLAASAVAGCDDGGDGDGSDGGVFGLPTSGASASGDGGGAAVGGVVSGPPLLLLPVTREDPGPCPSGATDAYTYTPTEQTGATGQADQAAQFCLHVDPDAGMTVRRTKSVKASLDQQYSQGFVVDIDLDSADAARFGELTGKVAQRQSPQNRIAMVRGGKVLSAPSVLSAITGGEVRISGTFDRDEAEQLARDLGGG
ncbi:SecDF P1 head subdomain-containing protein [Streptomyces sp. NPDC020480]|uniref:SecDF P1 head subdomain-containing protein n=1 Tax=Streptomyces sp. NPDC020480 TaxID=3365076 RepID=UPI0037B0B71F